MLIAVDPGVHACGVAYFMPTGRLVHCDYTSEPLEPACSSRVVCEIPQVYSGDGVKKAKALIDLAVAAGRMTGQLETEYVRPANWKGQVPKDIHHARVRACLTEEERRTLSECDCPRGKLHNVLDAIGLGLKTLGRM